MMTHKRSDVFDDVIFLAIATIGIAEAAMVCGCYFHWSVSEAYTLFLAAAATMVCTFFLFVSLKQLKKRRTEIRKNKSGEFTLVGCLLLLLLGGLVCSQLLFLFLQNRLFLQGDQTIETVRAFLTTDFVYQVNPLTGREFEQGMPSRIKILCLPMLYSMICKLTGLPATMVVWRIVPAIHLLLSYCAYASLSKSLFREQNRKRILFLVVIGVLFWMESYQNGLDGFGLLYSGWRGTTLRNTVLVPWLFSLLLRKKFAMALLCILGEACIVWTLYGMGVCFFVYVVMLLLIFFSRHIGTAEVTKQR